MQAASLLLFLALDICQVAAEPSLDSVCARDAGCRPERGGSERDPLQHFPRDRLREPPSWFWPNEGDELTRHGPVIDADSNIFLVTSSGWIRKFNNNGRVLWQWRSSAMEGKLVTQCVLNEGSLYIASSREGSSYLFSFSAKTGDLNWRKYLAKHVLAPDSSGLAVHNGSIFVAVRDQESPHVLGMNNRILALSTGDGERLWEYGLEQPAVVVNFHPVFPGDGTMLFATPAARAYRLRLGDGKLLWNTTYPEPGVWSGTGGGSLSPDGDVFFAVGSYYQQVPFGVAAPLRNIAPCHLLDCTQGPGFGVAYRVADGRIIWAKRFGPGLAGTQRPAVGRLGGEDKPLVVIAPVGNNPDHPMLEMGPTWLWSWVRRWVAQAQVSSLSLRERLGVQIRKNAILALDAKTGFEIWRHEDAPWDHFAAAGDEERLEERMARARIDLTRAEVSCAPSSWSLPVIGPDGTVFAGSGHTGDLHAIYDTDASGDIGEGEVTTFRSLQAFSGNPALAPGLLAVAPCWGPMYVFK